VIETSALACAKTNHQARNVTTINTVQTETVQQQ